jgi:EAL domain-containing protein (putative c-di-GMP-specific phosphodiesterase class I)
MLPRVLQTRSRPDAMPLSDFVRYLNAQYAPPVPSVTSNSGLRSTTPFVAEDGQVFVHFATLRLESFYSPIVAVAAGKLHGHAAGLNAFGRANQQRLETEAVFVLPSDDDEFIYLDRLARTLHVLNYLTYLNRHSRGTLLLSVHPRHLASAVAGHGMAFEDVLRACGLLPEQVMLVIEIDAVDDADHLVRTIADYKSRGYSIAVDRFGRREINFQLLQKISPAIVTLDPRLLASTRPLRPLVDRVHELGAQVMIKGEDSATLHQRAEEIGIDLLQLRTAQRLPIKILEESSLA